MTAIAAPGMLRVLSERTDFRWLWLGNLISVCGGWFSAVAVFAMVYHHTGAALAAGATLALRYLPGVLVGGFAGVLADRIDRRTLMVVTDLALAGLAGAFLLADSPDRTWLVYPLTFVSAATGFTFQAARNAWMPSLVEPGEYVLFGALVQVNGLLLQAVGGLAGAAAVGVFGWRWAFAINAVSFLVSAWCTLRARGGQRHGGTDATRRDSILAALAAGVRHALRHRQVRALLIVEALFCLGLGAAIVTMTFLATRTYRLGDGGVGWFYAAQGITGAAVLLWAAARIQRLPTRRQLTVLGLSCLGEGLATIAFGLAPGVGIALTCWAIASAADVLYGPVAIAILLHHADNAVRGRLMALWSATATGALALSSLAGGILVDRHPPGLVAVAAGALMVVAGAAWLALLRRGRLDPSPGAA
ncbi:MFS transporter [Micromonospora sp. KC723]|uniref:MFS transporter n=1 Tax=Micromonospora sp. KC723 TaxID=2530381 RepID=UPI001FB768DB|nr:MFS transporter [Micromonospora sp. KC723]